MKCYSIRGICTKSNTRSALISTIQASGTLNLFGKTGSDEKTSSRHLVEIEAMEDSSFDLSFTWRKYTFPNTSVINKENNKPISVSILYMIHRSFHQDRLIMTSTFLYLYTFILFLPRLFLFLSFNF